MRSETPMSIPLHCVAGPEGQAVGHSERDADVDPPPLRRGPEGWAVGRMERDGGLDGQPPLRGGPKGWMVKGRRHPAPPASSSFGMCRAMYTPWPRMNTSVSPISPNSLKSTQVSVSKL